MSATSYESKLITGSTGTQIQVGDAWTGAPTGKTYWIGAIRGTLALNTFDDDDAGPKHFHEINGYWALQTHSIPVRIGFTLDGDAIPTYAGTEYDQKGIRFSSPVGDRGVALGPYFDTIGTDHDFELSFLEVDYDVMDTRRPGN